MPSLPEPWLRGPFPGVPAPLQPAAHAFIMAREDVESAVTGLTKEQLWAQPGGIAAIGFHLAHLAGATDRLLTYARGDAMTDAQKTALALERSITTTRPPLAGLLSGWRRTVDAALAQLASTPEATLAVRGESAAAFARRCIPAGCVAPPSNTPRTGFITSAAQ